MRLGKCREIIHSQMGISVPRYIDLQASIMLVPNSFKICCKKYSSNQIDLPGLAKTTKRESSTIIYITPTYCTFLKFTKDSSSDMLLCYVNTFAMLKFIFT